MPRYIDADIAKEIYLSKLAGEQLDRVPTADVQEVKHAHWIPKRLGTCECSNCSEDYEVCGGLLGDYNYCPNCGSKMDRKD